MRHFAIYATAWPERTPSDGSAAFVPAPREIKIHRSYALPAAKIKQEAALSNSRSTASTPVPTEGSHHKRPRDHDGTGDERPHKKKKTLLLSRPRGRPPKHKVEMSAKAQKMLKSDPADNGRRSGRTRMPSLKLRENDPSTLKLRVSPRKNPGHPAPSSPLSAVPNSDDLPQNNDLPPMTPMKEESAAEGPKLPTPKSLAVAAQPREANGRFGKKSTTNGRFMRKNFSFGNKRYSRRKNKRKDTRPVVKQEDQEGVDTQEAHSASSSTVGPSAAATAEASHTRAEVLGKRPYGDEEMAEEVTKRMCRADSEVEDDDEESLIARLPAIPKVRSALLGRPNPIAFARRKLWSHTPEGPSRSASMSVSLPTDDDSTPPITPEVDDHAGSVLDEEYSDEEVSAGSDVDLADPPRFRSMLGFRSLTARPSPLNYARHRWAHAGVDEPAQAAEPILKRKDIDDMELETELHYPMDDDEDDGWDYYSSDDVSIA